MRTSRVSAHRPPPCSPRGGVAVPGPTVPADTVSPVGYRILITTAAGRLIAAGGQFATEDAARAWAVDMHQQYKVTIGPVVTGVPDGAERARARTAQDLARADLREHLAAEPPPVPTDDDPLLDIKEVAARYGIKVESIEQGVLRGVRPPPETGRGRSGRWRRSALDRWDHEAALRRRRPK